MEHAVKEDLDSVDVQFRDAGDLLERRASSNPFKPGISQRKPSL